MRQHRTAWNCDIEVAMPHQVYDLNHLIYGPVKDIGCGWVQRSVKDPWQQIWVSNQHTL